MFYALGSFAYRWRWLVLIAWVALAGFGLSYGAQVAPLLTAGGWDDPTSESSRTLQLLEEELSWAKGIVVVVVEDEPAVLRSPEMAARFQTMADRLGRVEGVSRVLPPELAADARAARVTVELDLEPDDVTDRIPRMREIVGDIGTARSAVTGTAAVYYDFQIQSEHDLREAERLTFPLALVALLFFFGSVASAMLPLLVAAVAVSVTMGLVWVLAQQMTLSIYVLNTATMLGLAVAIDYCLLVVSRFREELRSLPVRYAVARTTATAGRAVLFSGLTVLVGLSGLLFFGFPGIASVGVGGAVVVGFAVLASLTLLPAILSIMGPRVDFARVLRFRTRGGMWHGIATAVMRRPGLFIVAVSAVVIGLASPTVGLRLGFPSADTLPPAVESRVGLTIIEEHFGEREGDEVLIGVRGQGLRERSGLERLAELTRALEADPRVSHVTAAVNLVPGLTLEQYAGLYAEEPSPEAQVVLDGDPRLAHARERLISDGTAALLVSPREGALTDATRELVRDLRDGRIVDDDGLALLVGGLTAAEFDFMGTVYGRFPLVAAGIVLATIVILFLLLDSVILPFKAVVMNAASVLAAFGVLTLVFQHGVFADVLGVVPREHLEATLPIFIFCVLFGVSMDYEVFLLSRMREIWDTTRDNLAAVAGGLERTGRVVTSAALVFVLVVGSFARADIVTVKALGVALAAGILLDATIVRALLVPSTMRILGRWNWWSPLGRSPFRH